MKFTGRAFAASSLAALLLAGCSSATPSSSSTGVTIKVHDAKTLQDALDGAAPGETIVLAEGTYAGTFSASAIATATMPIVVRGTAATVIDAGTKGYGLHLENSAYWRIEDITISGGEKGIVLDRTVHVLGMERESRGQKNQGEVPKHSFHWGNLELIMSWFL